MNSNVTITLNNLRIRSSALTVELANGATFDLDGKDGRDWGLSFMCSRNFGIVNCSNSMLFLQYGNSAQQDPETTLRLRIKPSGELDPVIRVGDYEGLAKVSWRSTRQGAQADLASDQPLTLTYFAR